MVTFFIKWLFNSARFCRTYMRGKNKSLHDDNAFTKWVIFLLIWLWPDMLWCYLIQRLLHYCITSTPFWTFCIRISNKSWAGYTKIISIGKKQIKTSTKCSNRHKFDLMTYGEKRKSIFHSLQWPVLQGNY